MFNKFGIKNLASHLWMFAKYLNMARKMYGYLDSQLLSFRLFLTVNEIIMNETEFAN